VFVLLAMAVGAGGLLLSFGSAIRKDVGALTISSGLGLLLSWVGFEAAKGGITRQLAGAAEKQGSDVSVGGLLSFKMQTGFVVTEIGFAVALAVALFVIWSRREGTTPEAHAKAFAQQSAHAVRRVVTVLSEEPSSGAGLRIFCPACGGAAQSNDRFCSGCGGALDDA
jgi:hypothetical protein